MTPEQFTKLIEQKAKEIQTYANLRFPTEAGNTALRFINGNFRAQGWQGSTFKQWEPNNRGKRILVNKGHLRSANYYNTAPGIAIVRNTMPYAKINNEGGNIDIPITKNMRKYAWAMYYKYGGGKKGENATSEKWRAMALTKKTSLHVTIPQRQFAPTNTSQSPVLNNAIQRKIMQEFTRIFKTI